MADAFLYLMGLSSVGAGHRQGLGKYLLVAFGIGAYHVTRLKHQSCMVTKPFRALDFTQAVAMQSCRPLTAAGADGRPSHSMSIEGYTLAITFHVVQTNAPLMTFFTHD